MATETYELAIQMCHTGQPIETLLHFQGGNLTADATLVNGADLITGFITNVLPDFLPTIPASCQVNRLAARRVSSKPSAVAHTQFQRNSEVGSGGSAACSYQLCPTIFLVPPMGTISGGKIFWPAISDTAINGNQPQAGWLTNVATVMADMMSNFGTSAITWQLAIFSRKLKTTSLVLAYNVSPRLGFQRKRAHPVGA